MRKRSSVCSIRRSICGTGSSGSVASSVMYVTLVSVLGWLLPAPACLDRRAEEVHLSAGVVVVILALDVVARETEQPRDGVSVGAVARGGNGDRAGRVRRDHLDLHLLLDRRRGAAVVLTGRQDLGERVSIPRGREPEIDEAGTGDLGPVDVG